MLGLEMYSKRGISNRKYQINQRFFDIIDTEEKAYLFRKF